MQLSYSASPLQPLDLGSLTAGKVWIKRDDLIHPQVSGNKLRKLKYPLLALQDHAVTTLTTMGGPWSNHLHALAHAGALCGWPTRALVRGTTGMDSATLQDCRQLGMEIRFVTRDAYRQLREDPQYWRQLVSDAGQQDIWLPEGGSTPLALRGVAELISELPFIPDVIMLACGTGATMAGLLAGLQGRGRVVGIAVLKNADYLHKEIALLLQQAGYPVYTNYELITDAHHGGYGKAPVPLRQFCRDFTAMTAVPTEPVYTGKLFFALQKMLQDQRFADNQRIVAIHTGGMQGARGFPD